MTKLNNQLLNPFTLQQIILEFNKITKNKKTVLHRSWNLYSYDLTYLLLYHIINNNMTFISISSCKNSTISYTNVNSNLLMCDIISMYMSIIPLLNFVFYDHFTIKTEKLKNTIICIIQKNYTKFINSIDNNLMTTLHNDLNSEIDIVLENIKKQM